MSTNDTLAPMDTRNLRLPTEFTIEEIETLRALALKAESAQPSPFLHNLGVRLNQYAQDARAFTAPVFRMAQVTRRVQGA